MSLRAKLSRALEEPGLAMNVGRGLLGGAYYRLKYRVLRRRVIIGSWFIVHGRLDIRGPGTVIFGDHCTIISGPRSLTSPCTYSPEAVIRFGNGVMLTGTRLGCRKLIEVGDDADLADARIRDTDQHNVMPGKTPRRNTRGVAKPISIGPKAWICAGAMVLKGVSVGANSVVGAGAVAMQNVPPNTVVVGNPARVVWNLDMGVGSPISPENTMEKEQSPRTTDEKEQIPMGRLVE